MDKLSEWSNLPLVRKLTRQPRQKRRYAQPLSGEPNVGFSKLANSTELAQPVT